MQEVLIVKYSTRPTLHRSAPLCLIPPLGTYSPSSPPRLGRSTSTPFLLASAYAIARCLGVICLLSGVSPSDDDRFPPGEYLRLDAEPSSGDCVGVLLSPGRTSRNFPLGGVALGLGLGLTPGAYATFGEVVCTSGALTLLAPLATGSLLGLPSLFSFF